jgi:hypothetical protein
LCRVLRAVLLGLLAGLPLLSPVPAEAQVLREDLWATNGPVHALALTDDALYVGGTFTRVGQEVGGVMTIDGTSGAILEPFPYVDGTVHAVAPDGKGGWYVGGRFSYVRGQPRLNLAQLDAAGNVTAWNPGADRTVRAISASGGTIFVGGEFFLAGGQARTCLAALDTAGFATPWAPEPDGFVRALLPNPLGGTVFVGGDFSNIGGQARSHIAEINRTSGLATQWRPNASAPVTTIGARANFVTLVVTVYAGGSFTTIGGQPRSNLAALDYSSPLSLGNATSWDPAPNGPISTLAVSGTTIYIGGNFNNIVGQPRTNAAAVGSNGSLLSWNPGANGPVFSLALGGGVVYAGGGFTAIGGLPRNFMGALDPSTGSATGWTSEPDDSVRTIASSGGFVCAGGEFALCKSEARSRIAKLDLASGALTSWNPDAINEAQPGITEVRALLVNGNRVYVGGTFSRIGGASHANLVSLDAATGAASSTWYPLTDGSVRSLALHRGVLYVGGEFTNIGMNPYLPRSYLAALDTTQGNPNVWHPDPNGYVNTLSVRELPGFPFSVTVFAGGRFSTIGGATRNWIAEIDEFGAATDWNPAVTQLQPSQTDVYKIVVVQDPVQFNQFKAYVGGHFSTVGGLPRNNLAIIDGTTSPTSWIANTNDGVRDIALGASVFAGGDFTSIGQPLREQQGVAAFDHATGNPTDWNAELYGAVQALGIGGTTLYVGGAFSRVMNLSRSGIAALSTTTVSADPIPPGATPGRLRAIPNPFRSALTIRFANPVTQQADVDVYDLAGRRVRSLHRGRLQAGDQRFEWDGRSERGATVAVGVYFVRIRGEQATMLERVVRVR